MTDIDELEPLGPLRKAFRELTIAILTSAFKNRNDVASKFYDMPRDKQAEIEAEIVRRADLVSNSMCRKLVERGFLESEPAPATLNRIFRETLREFESV